MSLIHFSKVSALTILAVAIVACSSGGNHTKISPITPPLSEQDAAEKAAAEKAAAEKAAAEKAAAEKAAAEKAAAEKAAAEKAAAEKAAAEKAAAEKAAAAKAAAEKAAAEKAAAEKAAAEKAAAEKAEKERLQKIEANRLVLLDKAKKAGLSAEQAAAYAEANKQTTDKVAQTALETLVAEKAAADKAAADKAAAEKAEKERLQKIEANRLVLLDKAKKAGLSAEQAAAYAEANKQTTDKVAQTALETLVAENEKVALDEALSQAKGEYHNSSAYPVGQISARTTASSSATINGRGQFYQGHAVVYNQPYSVVLGSYGSTKDNSYYITRYSEDSNITVKGLKTKADAIPSLGTATYSGKAFSRDGNFHQTYNTHKEGLLSYDVNFNNRTGTGSITGLGDTVNLQQGTISGAAISAIAQQGSRNGNYLLDFFGKKAEEIAGKVVFDGKDTIGFGGTRGEISK